MAYYVRMVSNNKLVPEAITRAVGLRDCIRFAAVGEPLLTPRYYFEICEAGSFENALHSPSAPRVELPEWPIGARRGLDVGLYRVELKRVKSASAQAYEVYSQGRMLGLIFKTDMLEWAYTGAAASIAPRLGFTSSYAACRDLLSRYPDHMLESAF